MVIGIDASRAFVDEPTGTERYSLEMIEHILALDEAKKHTWVLFVKSGQKNKISPELSGKSNVRVIEIVLPRLWTQVGLAWKTWTLALDWLWIPAHTLPVLRKPGIKTMVTVHGIEYEWLPAYENKLQRWYLPLSTKYAAKTADSVVAVSKFTKDELVKRLGVDEKKISVVYEGYTSHKDKLNKFSEKELEKWALEKQKYVLFVGTIQPRKNLERLVEAFESARLGDAKLVIAGKWGWGYEKLKKMVENNKNIVCTGYINDTERYILLYYALFYIQPSITEGFGLPVIEAWDMGLAVASSNGGALKELGEKASVLFDPQDTQQMKRAMELLMDGKKRREYERLGKAELKRFGWEKAANNILELFMYKN